VNSCVRQVVSKTIFPANIMTGGKHPSAFSTNHLADTDKTKRNCNQEQYKNLKSCKTVKFYNVLDHRRRQFDTKEQICIEEKPFVESWNYILMCFCSKPRMDILNKQSTIYFRLYTHQQIKGACREYNDNHATT